MNYTCFQPGTPELASRRMRVVALAISGTQMPGFRIGGRTRGNTSL